MKKFFVSLAAVCILFGCSGKRSNSESQAKRPEVSNFEKTETNKTTVQVQETTGEPNGPTVYLFGKNGDYPDNKLADFMYFVPLISPVPVTAFISQNNTQGGHILTYESEHTRSSFYVACEFTMEGKGFYIDEFDDDAMVKWNIESIDSKKVLKNILDYIKFEGEGYGEIEASGEIAGTKMTVETVVVHFNARGAESPVTVGLYDVDVTKKTDGHYKQYNKKIARITTLTFNRSLTAPKLDLKISAVGKDEESLGTWAHIKGFLGNFFIEPIEIDKLGNNTMLEFGLSLYKKEATFTFPKAKNLIRTQVGKP
jgi:hypothetical protein